MNLQSSEDPHVQHLCIECYRYHLKQAITLHSWQSSPQHCRYWCSHQFWMQPTYFSYLLRCKTQFSYHLVSSLQHTLDTGRTQWLVFLWKLISELSLLLQLVCAHFQGSYAFSYPSLRSQWSLKIWWSAFCPRLSHHPFLGMASQC